MCRAMEEIDSPAAASSTIRARRYARASPRWCRVTSSSDSRSRRVRRTLLTTPPSPRSPHPGRKGLYQNFRGAALEVENLAHLAKQPAAAAAAPVALDALGESGLPRGE